MLIPEKYFIYISIFIVAIYIVLMIIGYKKGFLYELVNLLYTAASLAVAWLSPVLSSLFPIIDVGTLDSDYKILANFFNLNEIINTLAYFIIVFLVLKLLYVFISLVVKSINKIPVIGKFNQYLGAGFGFVNATLIVLCLSMLLSIPLFKNGNEVREKTILRYITKYSDEVLSIVAEKIGEAKIQNGVEEMDVDGYRNEFKQWLISLSNKDD